MLIFIFVCFIFLAIGMDIITKRENDKNESIQEIVDVVDSRVLFLSFLMCIGLVWQLVGEKAPNLLYVLAPLICIVHLFIFKHLKKKDK